MRRRLFACLALVCTIFLVSPAPARAHHGTAAYNLDKLVTMKAEITVFYWMNPHCEIVFDAKDDKGKVQHWVVEMHPPTMMRDRGWTRKSLNPGDQVVITFHPAKNGANTGILFKVTLPNGQELKQDA